MTGLDIHRGTAAHPIRWGGRPVYGGTLRMLGPGPVHRLDPCCAYDAVSGQLLRALTRQLFAYPARADLSDSRRAFTPVADIATEIPTRANGGVDADGRTYTIRLRPDARWDTSPPRPVTAHDFVRGFKRLANPVAGAGAIGYFTSTFEGMREYAAEYAASFACAEPTAGELAAFQNGHDIAGVTAVDDRTLVLRLTRPANDVLDILSMGFASPAPVEYDDLLPDSEELHARLRSAGPYRMAAYRDGGRFVRLERNPAWDPQSDQVRGQFVDAIELRASGEPADVVRWMVDMGEIDLAGALTEVSWARPLPRREAATRTYPGYALNPYLVLNVRSPNAGGAMARLGVRRAIAYAVDKLAVGKVFDVLDGLTMPLHGVIPPGNVGHRPYNLYPSPRNAGSPDRARRLLAEAGYPDGLTLVAAARRASLPMAVLRSVAASLERAGIRLRIDAYDPDEYYGGLLADPAARREGAWDIAEAGWTPDWFGNNGRAVVQPLFETNESPGSTNYGGYSNPTVDRLIARALAEPDPTRADELWHEVDRRVMTDVAVVPLLAFATVASRHRSPRVRNALHVPQIEFFDITSIWLDPTR